MNLEQKIKEHRRQLDEVEQPNLDRMWARMEESLEMEAGIGNSGWNLQIGRYWKWSIAASIALLLGGMYLLLVQPQTEQEMNLAQHYPHLAEAEQNYKQLIALKEQEVGLNQLKKEDFPDLFEELELLETIQTEYLKDIPVFKDKEQLINTLIRYYEQRIRILERFSNEIEKAQRYETRSNEIAI